MTKTRQKAKKNFLILKYLVMRALLYPPCMKPRPQTSPTLQWAAWLHWSFHQLQVSSSGLLQAEHPPLPATAPLGLSLYESTALLQCQHCSLISEVPTSIFHMIPTRSSIQVLIKQHPDVLLLTTISFLFLFTVTTSLYSPGALTGQLHISFWYDE